MGAPLGSSFLARRTADLGALDRLGEELVDRGVNVLAVHGGDGTTHHTLSRILPAYEGRAPPALLPLRGGTMNTVAAGLGVVEGSPEPLLEAAVQALTEGRPMRSLRRSPLAVHADDRSVGYGFLFGNGLASGFLSIYYDDPDPGPWTAVTTLVRVTTAAFLGGPIRERALGRVKGEVWVDGQRWEREDNLAVVVGAVPTIGLGFRPWYAALDAPDRFHAYAFACSAARLATLLPRLRAGRPPDDPEVLDRSFSELVIRHPEPQGFMIDGDYHPPARLIRVSPGPCLDVLLPDLSPGH